MKTCNTTFLNRIVWGAVAVLTGIVTAQYYGAFDGMHDNIATH